MPPPDRDDQVDFEETQEERRLLRQVRLRSFTATPATVQPFEPATLAWDVLVPPAVAAQLAPQVTLGGVVVTNAGVRQVVPLVTGAFPLEVRSTRARQVLGTRVVQVEATECQEGSLPRASIAARAQDGVKALFVGGSLSSRGDVTVSMRPPDAVLAEVPLRVDIPNFFNADVDVDLTVAVGVVTQPTGRRVVSVSLRAVAVDVIFHPLEHIASLGSAAAAQAMIQPLAADLIHTFLGPQIASVVRAPLQEYADFLLAGWKASDPAARTYKLFSLTAETSPDGLIFVGCPVPPAPQPAPDVDPTPK